MVGRIIGSLPGRLAIHGLAAASIVVTGLAITQAAAIAQESPAAVCRAVGSDNMVRPLPANMLAKAKASFGSSFEGLDQATAAVWRCMGGQVMACLPGSERHCGRADSQPMPTRDAIAYCAAHPGTAAIPTHATGRDTIFAWGCDGTTVKNKGAVRSVDQRGFVKEYWRLVE